MPILTVLHYHARIVRREQYVLTAGLWALFVLLLWLSDRDGGGQRNIVASYLGMVLPLGAGVLASGVIIGDPALELQFVAPRPVWRLLVERLLLVLVVSSLAAGAFQAAAAVVGGPMASLGGIGRRQFAWFVPCLALCGLAAAGSLATRHAMGGALLVGLAWIIQVFVREGLSATWWGQYLYLFMGARQAAHPGLLGNQVSLIVLGVALTAAAAALLRRTERYL